MIRRVYDLLGALGVTANYSGFFYAAYAVLLSLEDQGRLLLVTTRLYPEVAEHYETTASCVERNIRTVASLAWVRNAAMLQQIARDRLWEKPTASEFIAILTAYFLRQSAPETLLQDLPSPVSALPAFAGVLRAAR